MPKAPRPKKEPPPPKPWQRAEAGRYRSSDDRFTLETESSGRWFVTDAEELDELGLAADLGPVRDARRGEGRRRSRPGPRPGGFAAGGASRGGFVEAEAQGLEGGQDVEVLLAAHTSDVPQPEPEPAPPKRTWLDDLEDRDKAAARTARRMIDALEKEGIDDADSLVRRDVLGNEPLVVTRLIARDVLAAIAKLDDATPTEIAAAVADVLASSKRRANLPGWRLVERDSPSGVDRGLRITPDDLRDAGAKG